VHLGLPGCLSLFYPGQKSLPLFLGWSVSFSLTFVSLLQSNSKGVHQTVIETNRKTPGLRSLSIKISFLSHLLSTPIMVTSFVPGARLMLCQESLMLPDSRKEKTSG
jgi:hypothetical protein